MGFGIFLIIAAIVGAIQDREETESAAETTTTTSSKSSIEGTSSYDFSSSSVERQEEEQTEKQTVEETVEEEDNEVTMEEYKKIKNGMSYEEVVEIIGFEGTEMSSNELAGIKTIMYSWQNADGSNMNAMFQNNKLNSKAQFGLK